MALQSLHHEGAIAGSARPPDPVVAIDLPTFAEGTLLADRTPDPNGAAILTTGGTTIARVDTGHAGRGGSVAVDKPALHMSDVDERLRLSPDLLSRLDRDQVQRVHSASTRASREDRRSTTHPAELTFMATGKGEHATRRAASTVDPSRGVLVARRPSTQGGDVGTPDPVGDEGERSGIGGAVAGNVDGSPGVGLRDGRLGTDHRLSARVMLARPDVTLGPVSVEAQRHARPSDDVDTDQEVATTVRALVHASTAGGLAGGGVGGSAGGDDPGAGGAAGAGSHPLPLGDGEGDWLDLNTTDPRLVPYFRNLYAKIHPLWAHAFPTSALLDLKQGTVILEFTIAPDGTAHVEWPPVRPSGIEEFDRNCADAIRKASPFDPIPKALGRSAIRIRAPFGDGFRVASPR